MQLKPTYGLSSLSVSRVVLYSAGSSYSLIMAHVVMDHDHTHPSLQGHPTF